MTNLLFIILLFMLLNVEGHDNEDSCPNICICKWKGGKQTVECKNVNLNKIPDHIDPSTQVIDISGNQIEYLTKEIFLKAELQNLQKIFLRNSNVKKIDQMSFRGLLNLIELDLSLNHITRIPTEAFKFIPSLRELQLTGNNIRRIDNYAFKYVPNLIRLDMSNCCVEHISAKSFENLNLLQFLKINNNNLTEFNEHAINSLTGLHGIEMHNNPWFCDCKMRTIKLWLTHNNIPMLSTPKCLGGPKRVQNHNFNEMNIDDFACKPQMLPVMQNIRVMSNTNATILCKTTAIPTATIKWFLNGRSLDNNSALSTYQKIFIYEHIQDEFVKQSKLVLTNSQEIDSNDIYCVAENQAGNSEMNFTIHVTMATSNLTIFNLNYNIGISLILILLLFTFIILIILFIVLRLKYTNTNTSNNSLQTMTDSKIPKRTSNNIELKSLNNSIDNNDKIIDQEIMINNELILNNSNIINRDNLITSNSIENINPDLISNTRTTTASAMTTTTNHNLNKLSNFNNLSEIESNLLSSIILTGGNTNTITTYSDRSIQTNLHYWNTGVVDVETDEMGGDGDGGGGCGGGGGGDSDGIMMHHRNPHRSNYINNTYNPNNSDTTTNPTYSNLILLNEELGNYHHHHHHHQINDGNTMMSVSRSRKSISTDELHKKTLTESSQSLIIPTTESNENKIIKNNTLPAYVMPTNAKTLRVWHSGGVSVLPPITALKRVMTNNRNSPDEGYQEGCGTDV